MDLDGVCMRRREIHPGQYVLEPVDEHAADFIAKLGGKKDVLVSIRSPRNPDFHRWFFKYLSRVLEQTDNIWPDVETLLDAVKHAVGHTSRYRRLTNPHAGDMELAQEISHTILYTADGNGKVTSMSPTKVAKIIMALRRSGDEYVVKTKSISFAQMGEEKFREFKDKAMTALNAFLGWDTANLMKKENDAP